MTQMYTLGTSPGTPHLAAPPQTLALEGLAQRTQRQASIDSIGKLKVAKDPPKPHSSISNGLSQQMRWRTMKMEPTGAHR